MGRHRHRRAADAPHQRHPGLRRAAPGAGISVQRSHHPGPGPADVDRRWRSWNFSPAPSSSTPTPTTCCSARLSDRVSAQPLPQFLNAAIFRPLGLAMVMDPDVGDFPKSRLVRERQRPVPGCRLRVGADRRRRHPDHAKPTRALGGQLPNRPAWAARSCSTAQLAGAVPTEPGGADRYGAGIYLMANGTLDHDGAWAGFVTAFRVSKDRRTSVAVSCNTDKQDLEALADSLWRSGRNLWMCPRLVRYSRHVRRDEYRGTGYHEPIRNAMT